MSMSRRSLGSRGVIAAGVFVLAAPALWAQAAAPAAAPAAPSVADLKPPRIAVIDMQKVSQDSTLGKSYATQIETLRKEIDAASETKQKELEKLEGSLKALQDELEKQATVLSPEAQERKRQDLVKRNRDRQAFIEDSQGELQKLRERAQSQAAALNAEFQGKIKPIIDQVAKDKGIDILIDNQVALMFNRAYDISAEVVAKADAMAPAPAKTTPKP